MARSNDDIFKKFGDQELFLIGDTDEERAKILFVRSRLSPSKIKKRIDEWNGGNIPLVTVKNWAHKENWLKLRRDYTKSYEITINNETAKAQAVIDADSQANVRDSYANISGQIMKMIGEKLKYNMPSLGSSPIIDSKEMLNLSIAMKNIADVHFRALGIPEVAVIDPTVGQDGISILTKQDVEKLEEKKAK